MSAVMLVGAGDTWTWGQTSSCCWSPPLRARPGCCPRVRRQGPAGEHSSGPASQPGVRAPGGDHLRAAVPAQAVTDDRTPWRTPAVTAQLLTAPAWQSRSALVWTGRHQGRTCPQPPSPAGWWRRGSWFARRELAQGHARAVRARGRELSPSLPAGTGHFVCPSHSARGSTAPGTAGWTTVNTHMHEHGFSGDRTVSL